MKNFTFYILFFIFFLTKSYSSENIIFIDFDKIMNQSNIGQKINSQIKDFNKKKTDELKKLKSNLKKKEETLIKQKNIISSEDFNQRYANLKKEIDEYNILNQEVIESQKNNLINEKKKLIILLQPILADYMKKNDIKYIMNKQNILIGREDLNKTLEIIDIVNKKINN
jgi:Skp family chaperone for outer membrane proteins